MKQSCLLCLDQCNLSLALCTDCQAILPWQKNPCQQCGIALPNTSATVCGHCIKSPPQFSKAICLFSYDIPITQIIRQIKFHQKLSLTKTLGKLWIAFILKNKITLPDCIIPVPLHPKRLKARGFNQALEIAKFISNYFNIPIDYRSCIRIKDTKPQSSLKIKKRFGNIKNAFAISHNLTYKNIVIFDDVITTGNTVSEIAKLLAVNGVERIDVWSCARANMAR